MYAVVYTTAHYPIGGTFVPEIIADCMLVAEVKLLANTSLLLTLM